MIENVAASILFLSNPFRPIFFKAVINIDILGLFHRYHEMCVENLYFFFFLSIDRLMHQKKKQRKKHHFKWWYRLTQQKKNFLFFNNLMKPNDDDDHDDNLMIMMRIVFVPGTVFFSSFNFFPLFFRNSKIWHESHTTHTYEMESTTMNFFWFYQNFVPENKWMNLYQVCFFMRMNWIWAIRP